MSLEEIEKKLEELNTLKIEAYKKIEKIRVQEMDLLKIREDLK